jgi:hypothetical protein
MAGPTDDERLRIRGYLQAQAAKLTIPELIEKVRVDSEQLRAAAAAATDPSARPADGEWSVNEVLAHITSSSRAVNGGIVAAYERGDQPAPIRDAIDADAEPRPPLEWFDLLASEREAMFSRVGGAAGDEHLEVVWDHPFFGPLNWREWLLFLRVHDLDHARQVASINEALAAAR